MVEEIIQLHWTAITFLKLSSPQQERCCPITAHLTNWVRGAQENSRKWTVIDASKYQKLINKKPVLRLGCWNVHRMMTCRRLPSSEENYCISRSTSRPYRKRNLQTLGASESQTLPSSGKGKWRWIAWTWSREQTPWQGPTTNFSHWALTCPENESHGWPGQTYCAYMHQLSWPLITSRTTSIASWILSSNGCRTRKT